jgi:hypothetical protein
VRPKSPIDRPFTIGVLVASDSYLHVLPGSYRPASALITRALMLPVGRINIFVGLNNTVDHFDNVDHRAMCTIPLLN